MTRESEQIQLEPLIRRVEALLPDAPVEAVRGLMSRVFSRGRTEFASPGAVEEGADDMAGLYRLLDGAVPDAVAIRVEWDPEDETCGVLQTAMIDRPFIVDTIREFLHSVEIDIDRLRHSVFVVDRDPGGRITKVRDRSEDGRQWSVVNVEIDGAHDLEIRESLQADLEARLKLVIAVTEDFEPMVGRVAELVSEIEEQRRKTPWRSSELAEIQELLRWLSELGFVFLGYRRYTIEPDSEGREFIRVEPGSGLGILRDDSTSRYHQPQAVDELAPDFRARVLGGPTLIISKTNAESPIRRHVRMDYVGVKRFSEDGTITGEDRFLGLLTAKAYSQDASTIPILRGKLREVLQQEAAPRGSHDYNIILNTFNSMPKEELFLASVDEIRSVVDTVMATEGADDVQVSARPDQLGRGVQVLVILPRQRFSGQVRRKLQAALIEAYQGTLLNYHLALGQGDQARLHFYLARDLEDAEPVDLEPIEAIIRTTTRTWEERFEDALTPVHGPKRAHHLARRFVRFSSRYQAGFEATTAVRDLECLQEFVNSGEPQFLLDADPGGEKDRHQLRLYARRGDFELSNVIPTLENLGLHVLSSFRFSVDLLEDSIHASIQVFDATAAPGSGARVTSSGYRLADTVKAIHGGMTEDDPLNELVVSAGLTWEQVSVLRAYAGYAFRIRAVASPVGGMRPLTSHPEIARRLFRVFEARFDPAQDVDADSVKEFQQDFAESLVSVRRIETDRTLRRIMDLIMATMRTNFYRGGDRRSPLIALKFASDQVEFMPRPRPKHEVYLRGARTEACHLRMDDVARGGIRWSDRYEDFRVEVLGLVKTQRVKNAVIVPGGAKGAFIAKKLPQERGPRLAAGLDSYVEFIRGLLEISDNVVGPDIVHPDGVVFHDGDDPYLVVAADKGTAKNSDTANELAIEAGYWLGDAFASGGSQGYDHKEEGITARGAWECVKLHFNEIGLDYENEPFTVVGIGDMSGDVFGNGMLLSRRIRLVGAFDHRHIFLDPDPDTERTWHERRRLFELPGSSWADFSTEVLSEGGGVYERTDKRIPIGPQVQQCLGVTADTLNGNQLIKALLKAPVDLLWNGGIGTYVKARLERHADVGDPTGDATRVDGADVRAKVIGEGGNLGFTQRARVEYALTGGRINTDAVDNSAGVDMSDHEVNLKILLGESVNRGAMDEDTRNEVLRKCTDEVSYKVLQNNWSQSLALSLDSIRARRHPAAFRRVIQRFDADGLLDPALEFLPVGEEMAEREHAGTPLTRPELATVLSHAKLHLKQALGSSDVPTDPAMITLAQDYFPFQALKVVSKSDIGAHRLKTYISGMILTNRYVDRMGATSCSELEEETGRSAATIARTWYVATRVMDAENLYDRLRLSGEVVAMSDQLEGYLMLSEALTGATRWLLHQTDVSAPIDDVVNGLHQPMQELKGVLPNLLEGARREAYTRRRARCERWGLDSKTSVDLTTFRYAEELLSMAELIRATGASTETVGAAYLGLAADINFPWIRQRFEVLATDSPWDQRAVRILVRRLENARCRLAERIVILAEELSSVEDALDRFRAENADFLGRVRTVIAEISASEVPGLSGLVVAVDAIDQGLATDQTSDGEAL